MMKRYLAVVGIVLVVVLGLAVWLKPPLDKVREGVEMALTEHARASGEAVAPADIESHDWIVATSHSVKVGDETFFCFGAMKVTYCQLPD